MTVNTDQIQSLYNANVVDSNGDKVGSVGQVYLDDQNGQPSWVTVKTGLFGTNETFVPLQEARVSGDQIAVPYTKDFIKDAPNIDGEKHLDDSDQDNLFHYYNVAGVAPAGTDRGVGGTDAGYHNSDRAGTGTGMATGPNTGTGYDNTAAAPTDAIGGRNPADGPLGGRERADTTGVGTTANDRVGFDGGRNADLGETGARTDLGAAGTPAGGGQRTERGTSRFRIRKHTVTEQQTITVPVEREVAELVDDSAVGNSAVGNSAVGNSAVGNSAVDNSAVDNSATGDAARSGRHVDNTDPSAR